MTEVRSAISLGSLCKRAAVFSGPDLHVRYLAPSKALPGGQIAGAEVAVEDKQTAHHQQSQYLQDEEQDQSQYSHHPSPGREPHQTTGIEHPHKYLPRLDTEVSVECTSITFTHTIADPRTVMVIGADAPSAVRTMFGPQRLLDFTNSAVLALDEDLDFFRLGILIFQVDLLGCVIVLSCSLWSWLGGWCDICWMPVDD